MYNNSMSSLSTSSKDSLEERHAYEYISYYFFYKFSIIHTCFVWKHYGSGFKLKRKFSASKLCLAIQL